MRSARLILSAVTLVVCILFFESSISQDGLLLHSPWLDALFILFVAFRCHRNNLHGLDSILWLVITRRMCLESLKQLEAFHPLVSLFWAIWGIMLGQSTSEVSRLALVSCFLGMTFDPGTIHSPGMGMSFGWNGIHLNLLLLSSGVRWIFEEKSGPKIAIPQFAAIFIGSLFMLFFHSRGPSGHLTCNLLMSGGCIILFLSLLFSAPRGKTLFFQTLFLASLPIIFIALGLTFLGEPDLGIALQKRVYAGGLHANLFAAFSLAGVLFFLLEKDWSFVPAYAQRLVRWLPFLFFFITLFASGGRAAQGALIGTMLVYVALSLLRGRLNSKIPTSPRNGGDHGQTSTAPLQTAPTPHPVGLISFTQGFLFALLVLGISWRIFSVTTALEWSHNERFFIWRAAIDLIKTHPLVGYGFMAFGHLSQKINPDQALLVYDWNYPHSHQLILELLLSGGLPLIILFGIFIWFGFRNLNTSEPFLYMSIATLALGLLDFVWFTPSLIALQISLFLSPNPATDHEENLQRPFSSKFPALLLVLSTLAVGGFFTGAYGEREFNIGLEKLAQGDTSFSEHLNTAIQTKPEHLQLRLQRLFIRWATGGHPDLDFREVESLVNLWPDYYLPHFLLGRLKFMQKDFPAAIAHLQTSVELEPHDTMGIRWANLALAENRLGQNCASSAWQAAIRNSWGPAILFDHPDLGKEFQARMASQVLQLANQAGRKRTAPLRILYELQSRDLPHEFLSQVASLPHFFPIPPGLLDFWEMLRLVDSSEKSGLETILKNASSHLQDFGLNRLAWVLQAASKSGNHELIEEALKRIKTLWSFRNKNSDYLPCKFLYYKSLLERRHQIPIEEVQALLMQDPDNPWILELIGDAHGQQGNTSLSRELYRQSLNKISSTRSEPCFSNGPRAWALGPTGEQWTLAFEAIFLRLELPTAPYHQEKWSLFQKRLQAKLLQSQ